MGKWQDAIKEYNETQRDKTEKQKKLDAEDAVNKAADEVKKKPYQETAVVYRYSE